MSSVKSKNYVGKRSGMPIPVPRSGPFPANGGTMSMSICDMQELNHLREEGLLCDATIFLEDGTKVPVHRVVLCASSNYFKALFTTSLHGKTKTDVFLPGVTTEMMQTLLGYIYLRALDVTEENVYNLLITADYLGILGVLSICCKFLEDKLSPTNCIGIRSFARAHFCKNLAEASWKYIMHYFDSISQESKELLDLSLEGFEEIINADELVTTEETIVEAIWRWIIWKPKERKKYTETVTMGCAF